MKPAVVDRKTSRHPKLLWVVLLVLSLYTAALSVATSVRTHQVSVQPDLDYLVPFAGWLLGVLVVQRAIKRTLPNRDPWIFPCVSALAGWGIMTIYRLVPELGLKQMAWFLVGCAVFLVGLTKKDLISTLRKYKYVWLLLGLILIGLTFTVGVNPTGEGPTLWLKVFGLYIQPSEPLKLLMVIYLAAFFADQIRPNISLLGSILPTIVVIVVAGLLLAAQRDFGTAALFMVLYFLMLTVTTHRRRFLWIIPLVALFAGVVGYFTVDIVRTRVDIWLNPWLNTSGSAYQLIQAQIAVAAGGAIGTGPGLGSPQFVPVAVSDFIFSAIAEETGLLGTAALMLIMLILVMRGLSNSQSSKSTFGRYLALGFSLYLAVQSFLIIGGNLGILPLTGVTLPFLSYGGSSLVTNMAGALLLLKISTETTSTPLPENARKPYRWVAAALFVLFAGAVAWNSYLAVFARDDLLARDENLRWAVYDRYSPRGAILSQQGHDIVVTSGESGSYTRDVQVPSLSNTVGYANGLYGQSGLERSLYDILRGNIGLDPGDVLNHQILYNQPPAGLDVRLNINLALQEAADTLLGDHKGAIVLMNAVTGEIYVLASHPYFDTNTLAENWESLMSSADALLLNRTTQAAYPLGTAANTLVMAAYNSANPSLPLPPVTAKGRLDAACYSAMQSHQATLDRVQYGCESSLASLTRQVTPDSLVSQMESFGIFSAPQVALEVAGPALLPDWSNETNLAAAVEQITVSPLQMAMLAAAITNDGLLPAPKIVNSYRDPDGSWKIFNQVGSSSEALSAATAYLLRSRLHDPLQALWFQTGHASLAGNGTLTWYIGGTTEEWTATPLAIAIALEENNPALAMRIGSQLLNPGSSE